MNLSKQAAAPARAQDGVLAGLQLLIGLAALAVTWRHAPQGGGAPGVWLLNGAILAWAVLAAWGSLRRRRWGLVLGVLFFAVQLLHLRVGDVGISLMPNFNLAVAVDFGSGELVINLLALALLPWACWRACRRWPGSG